LAVQARLLSGRDVLPDRTRRLAACQQTQPLSVHRAAAAAARGGGFSGDAGGDGLVSAPSGRVLRWPAGGNAVLPHPPDKSAVLVCRLLASATAPPLRSRLRKSER